MESIIKLRQFKLSDFDAVVALWSSAGLPYKPRGRDRKEKVAKELESDNSIFLVAEILDAIVGVVFGTHDGRKGWINRLAVHPNYRHRGIARFLVSEVEKSLLNAGIEIMTCLIERENVESRTVFKNLGFKECKDIIYFSKRMNPDV